MDAWLCYDLRTYAGGASSADMVAAAIEQVAWADSKGFSTVLLPEHHGADDGYNPSPFVLAAAMASRTRHIRFHIGAVLLPLHDPLALAENAVMLDLISGGRVELTAGLGYVPSEFEMFGVSLRDRGRLADESLAALRSAFTGATFEYRGRRARVTPTPLSDSIPIYVGGAVPASARRAARFGDGYFPTVPAPELVDMYTAECAALGRPPGRVLTVVPPLFVHIAEDPEKAWVRIAPHAMYETAEYGRWAAEAAAVSNMESPYQEVPDMQALRASGMYVVVTPDDAVNLVRQADNESRTVNFKPMMGGLSPEMAWESLELFATKVLPSIREARLQPR